MKIKLPKWLQRETLPLPAWARVSKVSSDRVALLIEADTAAAYQEWFALLGVTSPDQYWLEVAYQCAKLDLQSALVGTEYDPRASGKPVQFNFSRALECAHVRHPKGKGADAATRGREARAHYVRIRGRMPF